MKDKLLVKTDDNLSGLLSIENEEYIFSYETTEDKNFISLTMPVRNKSWNSKQLHPIFEMHLPEGYLLSIIKKHFSKFTKTNEFGLLKLMSPSIKGRLSYQTENLEKNKPLVLDDILHSKDDKLFDELIDRFALNSPISGVQPKVLAHIQNKATLKLEQYIIKSWGDEYPQLALNEYICMSIVKKANIPVPEFYISDVDNDTNYGRGSDMDVKLIIEI